MVLSTSGVLPYTLEPSLHLPTTTSFSGATSRVDVCQGVCLTLVVVLVPLMKKKKTPKYEDISQEGALGGVTAYAKAHNLPLGRAKRTLEQLLSYTLHKPVRRRGRFRPVLVFDVDEQWVADLVDMQSLSRYNRGYKYILNVIDVLSKYAWAEPLKSKRGKEVASAFEKILKRAGKHRVPQQLQTDAGKEFYNTAFQKVMKTYDIHHFSTHGDAKASIVERLNLTLKTKMYRYFTASNSLNYINILQPLVTQYNHTYHRTIGTKPFLVTHDTSREIWYRVYGKHAAKKPKRPQFKVGDRVRLSKHARTFKKGYLPGWTEEIFIVSRVTHTLNVPYYHVTELDGTPIQGSFYARDLQKVTVDDASLFRIEKILKRTKDKVFVKWKGYASKYNSWVKKSELQ